MAFDFPNSPLLGEEFAPPGSNMVYIWNGVGWTVSNSPATGGTPIDAYTKAEADALFATKPVDAYTKAQSNAMLGSPNEVRLVHASNSQLRLSPWTGNTIRVNGIIRAIPDAGINISNGGLGLTAQTKYFVYIYDNAGVLTLEISAAVPALAGFGVQVKTGDPTRTLVGMVQTDSAGGFNDHPGGRHVASWFSRQRRTLTLSTPNTGGGSATHVEWTSSNVAVAWGGEVIDVMFYMTGAVTSGYGSISCYVNHVQGNPAHTYQVEPYQTTIACRQTYEVPANGLYSIGFGYSTSGAAMSLNNSYLIGTVG